MVKYPTLDFGAGSDLTVSEMESRGRLSAESVEPAWSSLSPSLCPSPAHVVSVSLSLSLSLSLSQINK